MPLLVPLFVLRPDYAGNKPWGGLASASGSYFLALQARGSSASQLLKVSKGQLYSVHFFAANRPG